MACKVHVWRAVVAKHVGFEDCVLTVVESLSKGFKLASFGCTKCGATHLDSGSFACKKHTRHLCKLHRHRWIKSPPVIGNPLAALGCCLEGATLYVGRVPCTAGDQQGVHNREGCMSGDCRTARVEGNCQEAFAFQG